MADEIREPLFVYPQIGEQFTVDQAVRRMTEVGADATFLSNQFRGFVQRRLVEVRGKKGSGRTASNLFELDDILAGKIFSLLAEAGVADNEILNAVHDGLYHWKIEDEPRKAAMKLRGIGHIRHPVTAALNAYASKNEVWSFRLDIQRHLQTGAKHLNAFLYNPEFEEFASPDPNLLPRTTFLVALEPILIRLFSETEKAN